MSMSPYKTVSVVLASSKLEATARPAPAMAAIAAGTEAILADNAILNSLLISER